MHRIDTTKFPCDEKGSNNLFPVLYGSKNPFDVIEFLRNFCLCFTKKQEKALIEDWTRRLFSEIMRKEKEYEGEEEWRIAHPGTQGQLLDFDYAIALYIDENIDSKWSAELLNIAETKNLDVYIRKKDSDRLGAYHYERIRTASH